MKGGMSGTITHEELFTLTGKTLVQLRSMKMVEIERYLGLRKGSISNRAERHGLDHAIMMGGPKRKGYVKQTVFEEGCPYKTVKDICEAHGITFAIFKRFYVPGVLVADAVRLSKEYTLTPQYQRGYKGGKSKAENRRDELAEIAEKERVAIVYSVDKPAPPPKKLMGMKHWRDLADLRRPETPIARKIRLGIVDSETRCPEGKVAHKDWHLCLGQLGCNCRGLMDRDVSARVEEDPPRFRGAEMRPAYIRRSDSQQFCKAGDI